MARRSFLTTFEISQLCEVNPTTVQNWVKEKKLKAHVTPGGHRRVHRRDLISFMKEFGMPIPSELQEPAYYVLIVDDETEVVELLASLFETVEEEVEIASAESGVEALLKIGERKPDLLILDIIMPEMNGIEVCQKLKSSPATREVRIMAVTGDHDPALRARAISAGADGFVTKPFDMMQFRSECLDLLHSRKGR